MHVLVVDIGGSHVKVSMGDTDEPVKIPSGPDFTPDRLMRALPDALQDRTYDVVSIGYPGRVDAHGPVAEPGNLGDGWVGFDFEAAFQRPVRVANDAVMQALGAYADGRMLFLGLGTGLGSAIVAERVLLPLELGNLPWNTRHTLMDAVGRDGLARLGPTRWQRAVHQMVRALHAAFAADYVVLGGGNAKLVDPLPPHSRRGGNHDAIAGGVRLWEETVEPHDRSPELIWRVMR